MGSRTARLENDYGGIVQDDAIRSVVARLGRTHPSGGIVIERAAIVAEGADAEAVITWILAHGGIPEATSDDRPDMAYTDRVFT